MSASKLIGPFTEILPLSGLPLKGSLKEESLQIIKNGGILIEGQNIKEIGSYNDLYKKFKEEAIIEEVLRDHVLLPGFIDAHTHMCFAGSRAADYAIKISGGSYQDILHAGGGIHDTVSKTRAAKETDLYASLINRCTRHLLEGITTAEVKSGYGLSLEDELKILRVINKAGKDHLIDIIPTCLAAHIKPKEFDSEELYLEMIQDQLFPLIREKKLSDRIDIFVEKGAFLKKMAKPFLEKAKAEGFNITIHADQFTTGGSALAVEIGASSADHLEASGEAEIKLLASSNVVAIALPGASLGLGMPFTPARKLLDNGACLAIASDWNPGSAPMGDLLLQAALLGAFEKLTTAETFAGITYRAASALQMQDRGILAAGNLADFIAFPTHDYREILYHQGKLKPVEVWKRGQKVEM